MSNSDIKRLAIRGVLFNWIGRGCSFVIIFFLTPYLVHTLGNEKYGLWSIMMSLTSYYALADLGLRGAGTKYIAQYHAVDDHESIRKVIATSFFVYSIAAAVVLMVVGIMTWVFPFIFQVESLTVSEIRWVVLLTGATVIVRLLTQIFGAIFTALHRFDISNAISVSVQLCTALGVVAALQLGYGLSGMAIASIVVVTSAAFLRAFLASRLIEGMSLGRKYVSRETFKTIFRFGSISTISRVAQRGANQLGFVAIGIILGPAMVIFFAIPFELVTKSRSLSRGFNSVLFPLTSRLEAQGDHILLHEALVTAPRLFLSLAVNITVIFFFFGKTIIRLWIGQNYVEACYPILCILSCAMLLQMPSSALRSILRGMAKVNTLFWVNLSEAIITVSAGLILIILTGIQGMAWAILLSSIVGAGFLLPYLTCQILGFGYRTFLVNVIPRAMIASVPGSILSFYLSYYFTATSLEYLIPEIMLVACVSGLCTLLICLPVHRRKDIVRVIIGKHDKTKPVVANAISDN